MVSVAAAVPLIVNEVVLVGEKLKIVAEAAVLRVHRADVSCIDERRADAADDDSACANDVVP